MRFVALSVNECEAKEIPLCGIFPLEGLVLGTRDQRESLKRNLSANFKMEDQGPISHYLNLVVKRHESSFSVSQAPYIQKILEKFNMTEAAPSPLPMQPNQYDEVPESSRSVLSPIVVNPNLPYRQLIGALIYLSSTTRPDISYMFLDFWQDKSSSPQHSIGILQNKHSGISKELLTNRLSSPTARTKL